MTTLDVRDNIAKTAILHRKYIARVEELFSAGAGADAFNRPPACGSHRRNVGGNCAIGIGKTGAEHRIGALRSEILGGRAQDLPSPCRASDRASRCSMSATMPLTSAAE